MHGILPNIYEIMPVLLPNNNCITNDVATIVLKFKRFALKLDLILIGVTQTYLSKIRSLKVGGPRTIRPPPGSATNGCEQQWQLHFLDNSPGDFHPFIVTFVGQVYQSTDTVAYSIPFIAAIV